MIKSTSFSKNNMKYGVIIAVFWTATLLSICFIDLFIDRKDMINEARISASSSFEKDLLYRRWNTMSGGVYLPLTEKTPSNPFLNIPNKDIVTQNGKALTLVNPAYMTRQVYELAKEPYGVRGHITSLNPIRPQNAADVWEIKALDLFHQGVQEVCSEEIMDNKPYLRFMRPMVTEKQCLKCHEKHGYHEGDIRGGISISVPLDPYFETHAKHSRFSIWMYTFIWMAGLGALYYCTNHIVKQNKIREGVEKKRKEAEEKLIYQNYYLKKSQELGQIGTWELDFIHNKLYWTDENCIIFGVPEGSVVDYEIFMDKVHPDDREYVDREWKAACIDGKSYDIEHRLYIDGKVKWVREKADVEFSEDGIGIKAIGVTQDITERKRAEEELSNQKKLFETMFNTIPDGVIITNNKREIQLANKGMEYTFGYKPEDLFGKTTEILYADKSTYNDTGKSVFNNNSNKIGDLYVTHYRKKDATEFSGETFGAKLFDENGDWIGNLGIMRDISERERAELMLQQAQKMESIGTLAGGIAHDFNNILSPIMMHTEMAMDDLEPNDPLYLSMKEIYKASVRARDLVKQILTFARKRPEAKILINSSPIVKEAIKFLRSTIPTTIDIQYVNKAAHDTIFVDPTQLNQIVMNLCTNAAHAMGENGGLLEVILDNEEISVSSANELINLKPGSYLKLSVRDTGSGIPHDIIERIFEPYYTTKSLDEGTGLGLATVHGIVQNYGGSITVESEVDQGTTFNVYIPLIDKEESSDTYERKLEIHKGSEHILIVDDEKVAVNVMSKLLERLGYKVTTRNTSMEALETFRNNPIAFDLVITDMTMPNMTGEELAKEIMAIKPEIPVILCTGFSGKIDEKKAREIGINAFVMKPIVMSEIAKTIREVLDKK